MNDESRKTLPAQGLRNPRVRHEGGIVPAPLGSSSDDGPTPELRASSGAEHTIAQGKKGFAVPAVPSTSTPAPRSVKERWAKQNQEGNPNSDGRTRRRTSSLDERRTRSRSRSKLRRKPDFRERHRLDVDVDGDLQDSAEEGEADEWHDTMSLSSRAEKENDDDDEDEVMLADRSTDPPPLSKEEMRRALGGKGSGRQGRPTTKGIGIEKKVQECHKELEKTKKEIRDIKDPTVAANHSRNRRVKEREEMEALSTTPTLDMPGIILEKIRGVDKVANKSVNLNGVMKGELVSAAATISAAANHLALRLGDPMIGISRDVELEDLRRKLTAQQQETENLRRLKEENSRLQEQITSLQQQMTIMQEQLLIQQQQQQQQNITEGTHRSSARLGKRRKTQQMVISETESEEEPQDLAPETVPADEEGVESRREEILTDIRRSGMPEAVRPPLQGISKIISPAVPPSDDGGAMDVERDKGEAAIGRTKDVDTLIEEKFLTLSQRVEKFLQDAITHISEGKAGAIMNRQGPVTKETGKSIPPPDAKGKGGGKKTKGDRIPATAGETPAGTKNPPNVKGTKKKENEKLNNAPPLLPAPTGPAEETWAAVVKRGQKKSDKGRKEPVAKQQPPRTKNANKPQREGFPGETRGKNPRGSPEGTPPIKARRYKVPRTSAVILTCPDDKYAETVAEARQKIKLSDLGIDKAPNVRRTATSALSFEISGPDHKEKADALAARMTAVLATKEGVRITRPELTFDLRLSGMEASVTEADIMEALASKVEISPMAIKVGPRRKTSNGLYTALATLPLASVNKLAKETRIDVGWSRAKIEVLQKKPLQCYRCLTVGHTRATCKSPSDRSDLCYRCGQSGHQASTCVLQAHCAICADAGLSANHRLGGKACKGGKKQTKKVTPKGKGGKAASSPNDATALRPEPAPARTGTTTDGPTHKPGPSGIGRELPRVIGNKKVQIEIPQKGKGQEAKADKASKAKRSEKKEARDIAIGLIKDVISSATTGAQWATGADSVGWTETDDGIQDAVSLKGGTAEHMLMEVEASGHNP